MAMYFDERAAAFAGETGGFLLQLTADTQATGRVVHYKIADTGKITPECELGNKV